MGGGTHASPLPGSPRCPLTTLGAQALLARPAALLPLGGHAQLPRHLVLHPGEAQQEPLLVDGFLQGFDGRLELLLHLLPQAVQVAAGWVRGGERGTAAIRGKPIRIPYPTPAGSHTPPQRDTEDHLGSPSCPQTPAPCPPVVSSGLISASNSSVMRVTSLPEELRARRPFPFLDESHLRLTKATWQSEQGAAPPACGGDKSGPCPCRGGHAGAPPPTLPHLAPRPSPPRPACPWPAGAGGTWRP